MKCEKPRRGEKRLGLQTQPSQIKSLKIPLFLV